MDERGGISGTCARCGAEDQFYDGADGFYYCNVCTFQSQDVFDTGVADEDFVLTAGEQSGGIYLASHKRKQHHTAAAAAAAAAAATPVIKAEPISQYNPADTVVNGSVVKEEEVRWGGFEDTFAPTGPLDFGLKGDGEDLALKYCYNEVRLRYLMGVQLMVEMLCKALVEEYGIGLWISQLVQKIWLRFVAASKVCSDEWADEAIRESEFKKPDVQEDPDKLKRARNLHEIKNCHGERAIMIWYKCLKKTIPLYSSLVVTFLACHVVREIILPTDIVKWALEGKLPYLAAFTEIERLFMRLSKVCPLSAAYMFKPSEVIPAQKLEAMAGRVAQLIGLVLPPVNFHGIVSRYLKQLSVPVERILRHTCSLHDWAIPSESWLAANELRLPSRVYVMAVLIVSVRILYNIHGYGDWEKSLQCKGNKFELTGCLEPESNSKQGSISTSGGLSESPSKPGRVSTPGQECRLDAGDLLCNLEATYKRLRNDYEFSKDLTTYLKHCKDVVFAATETSNDNEEEIMKEFWDLYNDEEEPEEKNTMDLESELNLGFQTPYDDCSRGNKRKATCSGDMSSQSAHGLSSFSDDSSEQRYRGDDCKTSTPYKPSSPTPDHQAAEEIDKNEAINRMKADMEENLFCYIPPRVNIKSCDYIYYARNKCEGAYTYVAYADYYILLRACARVAQVDIRIMHIGVLNFERRLAWLEKQMDI